MSSLPGKKLHEKEFKQRLIFTILAMGLILALTVLVLARVTESEEQHAFSDIKTAAEASDRRMVSFVEDSFRSLNSVTAFHISQNPELDTEKTAEIIAGIPFGPLGMETRVYLPDGRVYTGAGVIDNTASSVEYAQILDSMRNGQYISSVKYDYVNTDAQTIEFFIPMVKNGDTVALVSAVLDLKKLPGYMESTSFEGNSDVLFLDARDGVFFLDTYHNKIENAGEYANRKDKNGKSIIPFIETMISRRETYTTIESESSGKTLYIYAIPSGVDNWTAAIIISEETAFGGRMSAVKALLLLSAAEILVCIVYVLWIFRSAKRQALAGSRDLLNRMAGEDGLFLIDCANDTRRTIHNHCVGAENYSDEEAYSDSIKKYVENYVAESDRAMMREVTSLSYISERLAKEKEYTVEYRDVSSSIQRFYKMRMVKYSDTEVLQSFAEKDREIFDRLIFKKLESEYFALFAVDLDSGLLQVLKKGPWETAGEVGTIEPYTQGIRRLSSAYEGDTKAFFEKMSDTGYLQNRFSVEDKGTYVYRAHLNDLYAWVNVTMLVLARRKNGIPSLLALCFNYLDSDSVEKADLQLKLEASMQVVGGLASEYAELYHVNFDTGRYTPYYVNETNEDIKALFEKAPKFEDLVTAFIGSDLVDPDFRSNLRAFYPSNAGVCRALSGKKKISTLFRRNYGGEYRWTAVNIIKCEDPQKEAHSVIVGIIEKDAEIKRQLESMERRKESERTQKLADSIALHYNIVYIVNMDDDSLEIYKMDDAMIEKQGHFATFTEARDFTLSKVIHPRDRERMEREYTLSAIREKISETPAYTVEYCVLKNGATMWDEMRVTALDESRIIIGMAETDIDIAKKRIDRMRYGEYIALYYVDMDTGMFREDGRTGGTGAEKENEALPYTERMRAYAETLTGEEKEFFLRLSDLDYVKKELASDNKRTYMYRSGRSGDRVEVISYVLERHADGSPAVFSLGFSRTNTSEPERQQR